MPWSRVPALRAALSLRRLNATASRARHCEDRAADDAKWARRRAVISAVVHPIYIGMAFVGFLNQFGWWAALGIAGVICAIENAIRNPKR